MLQYESCIIDLLKNKKSLDLTRPAKIVKSTEKITVTISVSYYLFYFHCRNGTLHLMSGVCALVTKAELEYWGIDELLLEPCCALKYYPEIELCCKGIYD